MQNSLRHDWEFYLSEVGGFLRKAFVLGLPEANILNYANDHWLAGEVDRGSFEEQVSGGNAGLKQLLLPPSFYLQKHLPSSTPVFPHDKDTSICTAVCKTDPGTAPAVNYPGWVLFHKISLTLINNSEPGNAMAMI